MIKIRGRSLALFIRAILISTASFTPVFTAPSPGPAPTAAPDRVAIAPVIDGSLDDAAWSQPLFSGMFKTYNPTYGDTLPQKTTIWMAYDEKAVYFAFRCDDAEPDKIKTSTSQRDRIFADDWIGVSLDALGNRQSAIELIVNPNGIQADLLNSPVSGEDAAPDYVWQSAGRLTTSGYQVEIAVPLRSLRFKSGSEVPMNVMFIRRVSRSGIGGAWPGFGPEDGLLNQHMTVVLRDLKAPAFLELLPSATYSSRAVRLNPSSWGKADNHADFGIGVKYGLTSSLIADVTFNPDFSQVESDAFQVEVNRRYPVFYSEKRPFFMEGMEIFDFSLIPEGQMQTAVHTRRIADPLWGAKLTGTAGGTTLGVLAAGDESPGRPWDDGVNPNQGRSAAVGIARFKRGLGGENYVGGLYSGRTFADASSHAAGLDAQFRFSGGHQATFSVLESRSVESDSAEERNASAVNAMYYFSSRHLEAGTAFQHMGSGFDMPSAFIRRSGIDYGWIYAAPILYPALKPLLWWKSVRPQFIFVYTRDIETRMTDLNWILSTNFAFTRQGQFSIELSRSREYWGGDAFRGIDVQFNGQVQALKWLRLYGEYGFGDKIYYDGDPSFLGDSRRGGFTITVQPGDRLNLSVGGYSETFDRKHDGGRVYSVAILNTRATYQFNKYFFLRAITQMDDYEHKVLTDFLASFTWIPGTVMHLGYGSMVERHDWRGNGWTGGGRYREMKRGLFFKTSYLWRY
jgi:hypothetical protein